MVHLSDSFTHFNVELEALVDNFNEPVGSVSQIRL